MKSVTPEQGKINQKLSRIKRELLEAEPVCVFCGRRVSPNCDLAHLIPRSWVSKYYSRFELQTMRKNVGLAHRDCHEIFDSKTHESTLLPLFDQIMRRIKEIDPDYYNLRSMKLNFS